MIARTTLAFLALFVSTAPPAEAAPRQRHVEAFGADPCPAGTDEEIVVCARKPESERFRIPSELREPAAADLVTNTDRVHEMIDIGRTGTDSCSPVGPGGFTGCFLKAVRHGRDERRAVRRAREAEPD